MYSQVFDIYADLLKALAHPRRLEIIHLLRDQELPVTDIHTMLDLPQANISQHLMILRDAQVVLCRKDGKQIFYKLSNPSILKACDLLKNVLVMQQQDQHLASALLLEMSELVPVIQDPVCHMRVSAKTASFHAHYHGTEYYFCASGCWKKFTQKPEQYVKK